MTKNPGDSPPCSPVVTPEIFELRPDFQLISINVSGFSWPNVESPEIEAFVKSAEAGASHQDSERDAHLLSWRDAYAAFGAKPKRTPCSADALLKRIVRNGALPRINPLVDAYNAVSVMHGMPIGGEDRQLYEGAPTLKMASGTERFDTIKDGAPHSEHPEPGEVVWRDDLGVTCRRWNWRQGVRTRIEPGASELWFLLEALNGLPTGRLREAADQLVGLIKVLSPEVSVETDQIDAGSGSCS